MHIKVELPSNHIFVYSSIYSCVLQISSIIITVQCDGGSEGEVPGPLGQVEAHQERHTNSLGESRQVSWEVLFNQGLGGCDRVGQPEAEGRSSRLGMIVKLFSGQVQCLWLERALALPCLPLGLSSLQRSVGWREEPQWAQRLFTRLCHLVARPLQVRRRASISPYIRWDTHVCFLE